MKWTEQYKDEQWDKYMSESEAKKSYPDLTTPYEVDLKHAQERSPEFWRGVASIVVIAVVCIMLMRLSGGFG